MTVTIRRASAGEAGILTALAMISKRSNGYDDAFMAACADELRVTPALIAAHDYRVAADDGGPCGFACLKTAPDGNAGEVASLFVHPERQGRGIGRRLWAAMEQAAREKGLASLHLDADPAAEPFYRGLGLSRAGTVPSGSIPGRRLPHMRIDLSG